MKGITKAIVLGSMVILLILAQQQGLFSHLSDSNWLNHYIEQGGLQAVITLSLVSIAFTMVGGPRQVIATVFGACFGGLHGALFSTLLTLISAVIAFYAARLLFKEALEHRLRDKLNVFNHLLTKDSWLKVMTIRLLPIGSNLVTNLLAGCTRISTSSFVIGSTLGYLPQMFIFSFIGAGLSFSDTTQFVISLVLILMSALLVISMRYWRNKHNVNNPTLD